MLVLLLRLQNPRWWLAPARLEQERTRVVCWLHARETLKYLYSLVYYVVQWLGLRVETSGTTRSSKHEGRWRVAARNTMYTMRAEPIAHDACTRAGPSHTKRG